MIGSGSVLLWWIPTRRARTHGPSQHRLPLQHGVARERIQRPARRRRPPSHGHQGLRERGVGLPHRIGRAARGRHGRASPGRRAATIAVPRGGSPQESPVRCTRHPHQAGLVAAGCHAARARFRATRRGSARPGADRRARDRRGVGARARRPVVVGRVAQRADLVADQHRDLRGAHVRPRGARDRVGAVVVRHAASDPTRTARGRHAPGRGARDRSGDARDRRGTRLRGAPGVRGPQRGLRHLRRGHAVRPGGRALQHPAHGR